MYFWSYDVAVFTRRCSLAFTQTLKVKQNDRNLLPKSHSHVWFEHKSLCRDKKSVVSSERFNLLSVSYRTD